MAGLNLSPGMRGQFAAIARVRWQLFVNSLRTIRGRLELVSHLIISVWFAIFGIGGAIGLGAGAWYMVSHDKIEWLAALLWPIAMFWQLFPVMATAFTENFDSSNLLRFPLSYPSFFVIRLVYGSLDPTTALGMSWTLAIAIGIGVGSPALLLWAAPALAAFAILNILLGRMVFAWIERWLAQRRTREILGIVFFLFFMSFQFIGPLMTNYGHGKPAAVFGVVGAFAPLERLLPPGLAADAIALASQGEIPSTFSDFALLLVWGFFLLWLLHLRLRRQYRGENWSETLARATLPAQQRAVQPGWSLPGLTGPTTAVLEKELRYLVHSIPLVVTLVMPVFVLMIFRFTPASSGRSEGFLLRAPDLAFPAGAAYALLVLSNLIYNSFGAEGSGVQFYFVSPVKFREILVAKNLAHAVLLILEMSLVFLAVCFLFGPPSPAIAAATLTGILFALLVNLAVGNVLSLYSPKKVDYATFGRQRGSQTTVFASLGVQLAVVGLAALMLAITRAYGKIWLATVLFLILAAVAFVGYSIVLARADQMALGRREVLTSELSRA